MTDSSSRRTLNGDFRGVYIWRTPLQEDCGPCGVHLRESHDMGDWTTAGTNPKCPFWEEAFLIDACKPEVKHFSFNTPWHYQIGILKCLSSLIETICWKVGLNHAPRLQKGYFRLTCRVAQVDVTRDDSQRRFLAQHCYDIVATLFRVVTTLFQHCNSMHCIPV